MLATCISAAFGRAVVAIDQASQHRDGMRGRVHHLTLERGEPAPKHIRLGHSEPFRETEQALLIEPREKDLNRLSHSASTFWSHVS